MRLKGGNMKASKFFIPLFILLCLPSISYPVQLIYTIQTASFKHIADAQKQYDLIEQRLDKEKLHYLRIEKH